MGLVILLPLAVLLVGIQTWRSEEDSRQAQKATTALVVSSAESQKKLDAILKRLVDQQKITPDAAEEIKEGISLTEVLYVTKIEGIASGGLASTVRKVVDWILANSTAIATAIMAIFTVLVWRTYRRIEWWTGSMDSYSSLLLRIEASRGVGMGEDKRPVELVWWDPNIGGRNPGVGLHNAPIDLRKIHIFLPREFRQKASTWKRLVQSIQAALRRTVGS